MYKIQQVTSDPNQKQNLILPDGSSVLFQIHFASMQFGWFITDLVYGSFTVTGLRIVNSPNMLQQFRNEIPFGLACFSTADREPTQQQDFVSGASILYLLSADEVVQYTRFLSGQT